MAHTVEHYQLGSRQSVGEDTGVSHRSLGVALSRYYERGRGDLAQPIAQVVGREALDGSPQTRHRYASKAGNPHGKQIGAEIGTGDRSQDVRRDVAWGQARVERG